MRWPLLLKSSLDGMGNAVGLVEGVVKRVKGVGMVRMRGGELVVVEGQVEVPHLEAAVVLASDELITHVGFWRSEIVIRHNTA